MFLWLMSIGIFIWVSGQQLPAVVASHFNAMGVANGFMPRKPYLALMFLFSVLLPAALAYIPVLGLNTPDKRVNLPCREYWLAPERRQITIAVLNRCMAQVAGALALFLAYVHWLVVVANSMAFPRLLERKMIGALVIFVVVVWIRVWRMVRFFKSPSKHA